MGAGVQANAAVAGKMLVDMQRGLQAAAAEFLKASVRDLPRAVPGAPEKDGYVRKSKKRGGRTAKMLSCTVLASGEEIWLVDGAGIAGQIHEAGTAESDHALPQIIDATMAKAQQALEAQLTDDNGQDLGALAYATAAGSGGFLEDAPRRLAPPPEWAAIMAGAGAGIR